MNINDISAYTKRAIICLWFINVCSDEFDHHPYTKHNLIKFSIWQFQVSKGS
jgi:hypothetical protein